MNRKSLLFVGALAVAALALFTHQAVSQSVEGFEDLDPAEGMKRWMETAKLGEPHKFLNQLVGEWDTEMTMWTAGPGSPPMKSAGTARWYWLMDGRWLAGESQSVMMGMPLKGFYVLGFDNFRRKFVNMAINSMGTDMLTSSGNASRDRKSLILYGQMNEPMTGEVGKTVKWAWRFISEDEHVFEAHDLVIDENDCKVFEIRYTRKKKEEK